MNEHKENIVLGGMGALLTLPTLTYNHYNGLEIFKPLPYYDNFGSQASISSRIGLTCTTSGGFGPGLVVLDEPAVGTACKGC